MKYIANPVEVDAFRIVEISQVPESTNPPSDRQLTLEDGQIVTATSAMQSRMIAEVGDYWVVQADGYIYINPRDVFERKYHPADGSKFLPLHVNVHRIPNADWRVK